MRKKCTSYSRNQGTNSCNFGCIWNVRLQCNAICCVYAIWKRRKNRKTKRKQHTINRKDRTDLEWSCITQSFHASSKVGNLSYRFNKLSTNYFHSYAVRHGPEIYYTGTVHAHVKCVCDDIGYNTNAKSFALLCFIFVYFPLLYPFHCHTFATTQRR